jgi:hypothetical protein
LFTDEMKNLQPVDEVVYLSHEPLHEDDSGKADAEGRQLCWKCLEQEKVEDC